MEGKAFVLLGVNSDEDRAKLREAMVKEKLTWRSFWNGGGTQGPISTAWNIHGWPTLFVIDQNGIIRHKHMGSPGDQKLDEEIDKLVAAAEQAGGPKEPDQKKTKTVAPRLAGDN